MAIVRSALCQAFVELKENIRTCITGGISRTHRVFNAISFNVMVGSGRLFKLIADHYARTLRGRATSKQHDAGPSVWEHCLQQTHGDAERNTSATQHTLIIRNGPSA
jgi:hypothetical protein